MAAGISLLRHAGPAAERRQRDPSRLATADARDGLPARRGGGAPDAGVPGAHHGADRTGPADPSRDAAEAAIAPGSRPSTAHQRSHAPSAGRDAVRERRRAPRAGARGPRRQARDVERDQAAREELAGGLAESVANARRLLLERAEEFRRQEPPQLAWALRRQLVDVDPADRTLLELDAMARADEPRGQLADAGFVPDDRDVRFSRVLLEVGEERGMRAARRERFDGDDRRPRIETGGDDLRGLPGAHQRAGENDVDGDVEAREAADRLAQPRHPVFAERPL